MLKFKYSSSRESIYSPKHERICDVKSGLDIEFVDSKHDIIFDSN